MRYKEGASLGGLKSYRNAWGCLAFAGVLLLAGIGINLMLKGKESSFLGPTSAVRGIVVNESGSLKGDRSVISYRVSISDALGKGGAIQVLYARENSCQRPRLARGDVVWLVIEKVEKLTVVRGAANSEGCVIFDRSLQDHIRDTKRFSGLLAVFSSVAVSVMFFVLALMEWRSVWNANHR